VAETTTPSRIQPNKAPRSARINAARLLLAVAALGAAAAAIGDISTVQAAGEQTLMVETWRLCGFVLCAGLFAVLAIRPTAHRGVWEMVIVNKLALSIAAACFIAHGGITGAASALTWDGLLAALLISGYLLVRGWRNAG
jgi:hypothetical protein